MPSIEGNALSDGGVMLGFVRIFPCSACTEPCRAVWSAVVAVAVPPEQPGNLPRFADSDSGGWI